jgi:DNA-binding transcriptional ArsR family regulator
MCFRIYVVAIVVDVGVVELAATRFAMSPLGETVSGLQLLGLGSDPGPLRPWARWARGELRRSGLSLPTSWPLLLTGRKSFPEFLTPSPPRPEPAIDEELDRVRRTRAAQVRTSVRRVFGADRPEPTERLIREPAATLREITDELRAAHDLLVAPHWSRLRAVLIADIGYRARRLAVDGAGRLFADLNPDVTWDGGRLRIERMGRDQSVSLGSRGLVLVPSVLNDRHVRIKLHTTTQIALRYPARGIAELWTAGLNEPRASAVHLLGRPRATLLEAMRAPATTGGLAQSLGVTPSAVSQHLRVLRASGLVATEQAGRSAVHLITDLGCALLDPGLP